MLLSSSAQAMLIGEFDKMADLDQIDYTDDLVSGAEKMLIDAGKPALAEQVKHLFTTRLNRDEPDTIGITEFKTNLELVRAEEAHHPQERSREVEDVFVMTLEDNHIRLPDSFYEVNKSFRPKLPPKK